ncbi:MAG: hypothetical protein IJ571_00410 [Ruminococcus sp.]|nr:hypothetical protein [Ruminococcus sp.]
MLHGYFDVPTIAFFDQGNVWAGSMFTNFSYKIDMPKNEDGEKALRLRIWYGTESFDLVEGFVHESSYESTAQGYEELLKVLNEQFEVYKNAPEAKPSGLNL